ncbi:hypothetical protein MPER_07479, partial [Moniliophthora perniciosa FA553]
AAIKNEFSVTLELVTGAITVPPATKPHAGNLSKAIENDGESAFQAAGPHPKPLPPQFLHRSQPVGISIRETVSNVVGADRSSAGSMELNRKHSGFSFNVTVDGARLVSGPMLCQTVVVLPP